jgi:DNA-binding MarR family transcriptional regulator
MELFCFLWIYIIAYAIVVITIVDMNVIDELAAAAVDIPKPKVCTNLKLRQITRRVTQYYDVELAKTGLRTTQYSLLSHVVKLGPIRAVDLAGVMRMSTSTLSRNLQPLVSIGWLEVNAGDDARSRLISATAAGQIKRTDAQRKWRVAQDGINHRLGLARVLALHTLIDESLVLLSPLECGNDDV